MIKRNNKELDKSRVRLSEANERAKRSILSKSMFLSNMTHEIRTPLNAIVGFSEVLSSMGDAIDDETRQMCGDSIRQNAQLLHKLINDVMELSEQEENNMSFNLERHEVVALCQRTIETIEKVKRTSAEIVFHTSLNELVLKTDSTRLQQVLINLLINATKFTPKGPLPFCLISIPKSKRLSLLWRIRGVVFLWISSLLSFLVLKSYMREFRVVESDFLFVGLLWNT